MCGLAFVVRLSLLVVRCLLFVVCCVLCWSLFDGLCLLIAGRCFVARVRWFLRVVC